MRMQAISALCVCMHERMFVCVQIYPYNVGLRKYLQRISKFRKCLFHHGSNLTDSDKDACKLPNQQ